MLSSAFQGGHDFAVASSMPSVIVVDNGKDQQRRSRPAKERAVELAEAIHRDNGKGKREKKERGGGGGGVGVSVGDDDNAPRFAVG